MRKRSELINKEGWKVIDNSNNKIYKFRSRYLARQKFNKLNKLNYNVRLELI